MIGYYQGRGSGSTGSGQTVEHQREHQQQLGGFGASADVQFERGPAAENQSISHQEQFVRLGAVPTVAQVTLILNP